MIHHYTCGRGWRWGIDPVSVIVRQASIGYVVALARATYRCLTIPAGVRCQVEAGRLWDILWMLRLAIGQGGSGSEVRFGVHVHFDSQDCTPHVAQG